MIFCRAIIRLQSHVQLYFSTPYHMVYEFSLQLFIYWKTYFYPGTLHQIIQSLFLKINQFRINHSPFIFKFTSLILEL